MPAQHCVNCGRPIVYMLTATRKMDWYHVGVGIPSFVQCAPDRSDLVATPVAAEPATRPPGRNHELKIEFNGVPSDRIRELVEAVLTTLSREVPLDEMMAHGGGSFVHLVTIGDRLPHRRLSSFNRDTVARDDH